MVLKLFCGVYLNRRVFVMKTELMESPKSLCFRDVDQSGENELHLKVEDSKSGTPRIFQRAK